MASIGGDCLPNRSGSVEESLIYIYPTRTVDTVNGSTLKSQRINTTRKFQNTVVELVGIKMKSLDTTLY